MVVPGVGVYNAGAGLATAYACSSPVLLLAGQVNRAGIGNDLGLLHDVHDQLDLVRPITKWAERVLEAGQIPDAVRTAFRQMATGRPRPVEVEIPPEAFSDTTDCRHRRARRGRARRAVGGYARAGGGGAGVGERAADHRRWWRRPRRRDATSSPRWRRRSRPR